MASENQGFKPQVVTWNTGKVKRAIPESAAKILNQSGGKISNSAEFGRR